MSINSGISSLPPLTERSRIRRADGSVNPDFFRTADPGAPSTHMENLVAGLRRSALLHQNQDQVTRDVPDSGQTVGAQLLALVRGQESSDITYPDPPTSVPSPIVEPASPENINGIPLDTPLRRLVAQQRITGRIRGLSAIEQYDSPKLGDIEGLKRITGPRIYSDLNAQIGEAGGLPGPLRDKLIFNGTGEMGLYKDLTDDRGIKNGDVLTQSRIDEMYRNLYHDLERLDAGSPTPLEKYVSADEGSQLEARGGFQARAWALIEGYTDHVADDTGSETSHSSGAERSVTGTERSSLRGSGRGRRAMQRPVPSPPGPNGHGRGIVQNLPLPPLPPLPRQPDILVQHDVLFRPRF